jgi:hypothetical protein
MVVSATANEFSWELINRVIVTEPRLDSVPVNINALADGATIADGAMILEPSLLKTPTALPTAGPLADAAVILARTGLSVVAEIGEAADLLRRQGIAVLGAVVVTSPSHRWRKWRRFADAFGVGRNPERPWPVIDVLEEEIARTRRGRKSQWVLRTRKVRRDETAVEAPATAAGRRIESPLHNRPPYSP